MYVCVYLIRSFILNGAMIGTRGWARTLGLFPSDLTEELEKTTFPLTTDTTVHRYTLIALDADIFQVELIS